MPTYRIEGKKGEHLIAEQAHSLTKAQWIAAMYVEHGYQIKIVPLTPHELVDMGALTSGSL